MFMWGRLYRRNEGMNMKMVSDKNSECAKHLNENDNHEFKWSILSLALKV